jgi:hypothetical protein
MRSRYAALVIASLALIPNLASLQAQEEFRCQVPRARLVFSTPPGAIPEINFPRMIPASQASYLRQEDRVLGYVYDGIAKAYPYRIFWWHEVINDSIAGRFITITYCPLTNTGINFLSTIRGKRYTFLPSGLLFNNNLVMTSNEDPGLWPQMCPADIQIDAARTLTQLPLVDTTWDMWRRMHPNTLVVSDETGFNRDYTLYPYGDYETNDDLLLFPIEPDDRRLPRKRIVFGVTSGRAARAYPYNHFATSKAINDSLGGESIVVLLVKESLSGAAFQRTVDEQVLTFDAVSQPDLLPLGMRDRQTGTLWNFMGEAVEGALAGRQLDYVPSYNAFWFGWAAIWTNSDIAPAEVETPAQPEDDEPTPTTFRLLGAYPNPATVASAKEKGLRIRFELSSPATVRLSLYDILGRRVRVLVEREFAAGSHTARWNGRNEEGGLVSPGNYFAVLAVDGKRTARRIALIR